MDAPAPHPLGDKEVLNAFPSAALAVDGADRIVYANAAAEALLHKGEPALQRLSLVDLFGAGDPLAGLAAHVRRGSGVVVARETRTVGVLTGLRFDIQAAQIPDRPGTVLLVLGERRLPGVLSRAASMEGASRSVFGLAAMLAHEIKNPLSGIRGAAQILGKKADDKGRAMADIIGEEVERIRGLVDQLERFTDVRPFEREALNIHAVLGHVRALAAGGFAGEIRICENFDPSLPPVWGERDRLIQIFLNLVKNAAEALPAQGGEITLSTAYRHGLRLRRADDVMTELPIEISVRDNGAGVPAEIAEHVFDPFVTARQGGSGLGLAMVAKLVAEHGGLADYAGPASGDGGAVFKVLLPAAPADAARSGGHG